MKRSFGEYYARRTSGPLQVGIAPRYSLEDVAVVMQISNESDLDSEGSSATTHDDIYTTSIYKTHPLP